MTDLGKHVWDMGTALARAQAEMAAQSAPKAGTVLVFLVWDGAMLLGVCGTMERAEKEAEAFEHLLHRPMRVDAREVHS